MVTSKKVTFVFVLVGVLCFYVSAFEKTPVKPGLLARINKKTFDYVTNIGVNQAVEEIKRMPIPDQRGRYGKLEYRIQNMKIDSLTIKSHSVVFLPEQGIKYKFADTSVTFKGDVRLKYWIFRTTASFEVKDSRIGMSMTIRMGLDNSTGRPTIMAGDCHSNIPKPHLRFKGRLSWLINMFSGKMANMMKRQIQAQICSSSTMNKIDTYINSALQKMPTSQNFLNYFKLDFKMIKSPDIKSASMYTQHKGEVFWITHPKECPFPVRPMEPLPASTDQAMASVQISPYLLNSFAYVAYKNKILKYIFTSKNIPKAELLNTTCQSICIGKLIPALAKAYPNQEVSISIDATEMPEPNIINGSFTLDGTITITIYLSTDTPDKPLLIIPVKIHSVSAASIENQIVHYNISELKLDLGLITKVVPLKIDVVQLQHTINFGINAFVIPQINAKGKNGYPLPANISNVKLINTHFLLGHNSGILMTDFVLNGFNIESDEESDTWFHWLMGSFGYPGYQMLSSFARINMSYYETASESEDLLYL